MSLPVSHYFKKKQHKCCFLRLQENKLPSISMASPKSQISLDARSSPQALLVGEAAAMANRWYSACPSACGAGDSDLFSRFFLANVNGSGPAIVPAPAPILTHSPAVFPARAGARWLTEYRPGGQFRGFSVFFFNSDFCFIYFGLFFPGGVILVGLKLK